MAKKMLIDATHAEECRVVVVDGTRVDEFDFESVNKRQLAGNIYLAKVTRVEPSLQAAFVDYGGNRHGFLAFSEVHPDYYQIPVADREALLAEERAYAASLEEEDEKPAKAKSSSRSRSRSRSRSKPKAAEAKNGDAVETREVSEAIPGMDVVDLGDDSDEALPLTGDAAMADAPEAEQASPPQPSAGQAAEDPSDATAKGDDSDAGDDEDNGDDSEDDRSDASERDSDIESVADEDVSEEIRQPRKPRPKRYKIQEVIKVRQILLVQVVKEERGNKGAALTTYLSLAGRYCVLMPNTARGGGISRKITNAADRKKLKEIAGEIEVPEGAGLIIRTAGANRTKSEIKRDYEYLQRLWEQIRELTLKSVAPAPIYEEGNLIKRTIRDLYSREIDEVLVEGEAGYRVAKDFMKMIMPSHAKNVKHYTDPMPLFARYQVESYLSSMFNPTVQLRSGGYIVIGITEALVAVDVNSGRATKEGSIEETALKTNLEAAEEVARQMRLRDLAGLIVIDFIDMEERKNNAAVEKKLKDKLKTDRARIQVGRISGFGLLEMSRQRLRPGMLEATTQPCPACHGTGLIRSDDNLALSILRQLEEEGVRGRSKEVLLKAPVGIVNYLMNQKREHIAQIEARYGIAVRVEADPFLISPDFSIERFKTATRHVAEVATQAISIDMSDMPEAEEPEQEPEVESVAEEAAPEEATTEETQAPKKRRRRRRRKKSGSSNGDQQNGDQQNGDQNGDQAVTGEAQAETPVAAPEAPAQIEEMTPAAPEAITEETPTEAEIAAPVQAEAEEAQPVPVAEEPQPQAMPEPEPEVEPAPQAEAEPEPVATAPEPEPEPELTADAPEEDDKPKKRGWWSLRS
ncbi:MULTISPECIES: Rne/Rng family ribonuclease [Actibacterium]|uniref:Ribonuclease E n=1 Tax=Actibacterium naphthalenivorans TaxID=1614693 RepID=A0A840CDP4_9RHOB|nr:MULTISPECIES: ribonuclease E/G [Actibacterium]ALG90289.1 ribonuclease [Actibacterium sp. EMB200-NS6]MBB4022202.1 ribonuclease E [Actibacterium naphthalenivorans]